MKWNVTQLRIFTKRPQYMELRIVLLFPSINLILRNSISILPGWLIVSIRGQVSIINLKVEYFSYENKISIPPSGSVVCTF